MFVRLPILIYPVIGAGIADFLPHLSAFFQFYAPSTEKIINSTSYFIHIRTRNQLCSQDISQWKMIMSNEYEDIDLQDESPSDVFALFVLEDVPVDVSAS